MTVFQSERSKRDWARRAAWTVGEFARLCCGWDPEGDVIPDPGMYRRVAEAIKLTVRVRASELPIIADLRWPAHDAELFYDKAPLFKPESVWRWAADHYPKAFPFGAGDFPGASEHHLDGPLPRLLVRLLDLRQDAAALSSQKEVQALIESKLRVGSRNAEVYAALIRSDESAAQDGRASRHRARRSDGT